MEADILLERGLDEGVEKIRIDPNGVNVAKPRVGRVVCGLPWVAQKNGSQP